MKFVLLSDLHFVPEGRSLFGLHPQKRFEPCIGIINTEHQDAEFILVAGDLVHRGEPEAYRSVASTLSRFEKPVHLMLGNHDNREAFFGEFPDAERDENGFVQFVIDTDTHRLICLDTLRTGAREGELCATRLGWLAEQLQNPREERKLVLIMHHPPFDIGIPTMDLIRMQDDKAFIEVMNKHGWPDQFIFGHVHRPICGSWHGVPFHIQRAINHQVSLKFSPCDWIEGTDELPDYSVIHGSLDHFLVFSRSFGNLKRKFDLSPIEADAPPPNSF